MLVVISPAKKLDMSADERAPTTVPDFAGDAAALADVAGRLSHDDLRALMSISPALAELNAARFAAFGTQPVKAAALALRAIPIRVLKRRRLMMMKWPGRRPICAFCRAFTVCCGPWMRSSRTGWRWAAA